MKETTAIDVLVCAFEALSPKEQEQAQRRISRALLARQANDGEHAARFLSSLVSVADFSGTTELTVAEYKQARAELNGQDHELEPVNRIIRHYGSWRRAREALQLSAGNSAPAIEARLRKRRLGKVWRYSETTLRQTLQRCARDLGHAPRMAEYEFWRRRQLDLAAAQGDDALHLPSYRPYRSRHETWEKALLYYGLSPEAVAARLDSTS